VIAVFNTTPLISLATIEKLHLLQQLFKSIYIPQAVYYEIKAKHSFAYQEVDADWVKVKVVQDKAYLRLLSNELDSGEAEALCLAKELVADTLVIDERIAYKIAKSQGIFVIGTLTILSMAKKAYLVEAVKPLLDEMIHVGRWYSPAVYHDFLKKIGEL
jgi:predicted nucleic acid-binding protein